MNEPAKNVYGSQSSSAADDGERHAWHAVGHQPAGDQEHETALQRDRQRDDRVDRVQRVAAEPRAGEHGQQMGARACSRSSRRDTRRGWRRAAAASAVRGRRAARDDARGRSRCRSGESPGAPATSARRTCRARAPRTRQRPAGRPSRVGGARATTAAAAAAAMARSASGAIARPSRSARYADRIADERKATSGRRGGLRADERHGRDELIIRTEGD